MKETYLGDGLYCSYDGYQFILRAPKGYEDHTVALEPMVLQNFFKVIEDQYNVKIEIKKLEKEAE